MAREEKGKGFISHWDSSSGNHELLNYFSLEQSVRPTDIAIPGAVMLVWLKTTLMMSPGLSWFGLRDYQFAESLR